MIVLDDTDTHPLVGRYLPEFGNVDIVLILHAHLVQAITRGSDDLGKVHIQISHKGKMYHGFGANTDIVTASVESFIDAISKIA